MDDDPRNFAFVKALSNPLELFVDAALAREFSGTSTVNPMLGISIWLDSALAYRNLFFAQLHNVAILAITLLLFFAVLRGFGLKVPAACVVLFLWLLSPPMVIVSGWLAARHHLEGLLWSFAAIFIAQKLVSEHLPQNWPTIGALLACLAIASLFKETFAITVPLGVGLYLWFHSRRVAALCCGILLVLYCIYRTWMVGVTIRYDAPFLGPWAFFEFLTRLPYILVGNAGAYLLLALALIAAAKLAKRGELNGTVIVCTVGVIASLLLVIYPGAYALDRDWLQPRTWIRIVLLLQTGLLMGAGILFSRMEMPVRFVAASLALPIIAFGGITTKNSWGSLRAQYLAEGRYYLRFPDRLLYSEVPAGWYLDGLHALYAVPVRHYITRDDQRTLLSDLRGRYQTIWRLSGNEFVEDPELYRELVAKEPADSQ